MADGGWVRLADIEPGGLFEMVQHCGGDLFVRTWHADGVSVKVLNVRTEAVFWMKESALVRPLTAVRLHPSLAGSELWGLVRRWAAEPGDVTAGVLLDALADHAGRDPDVAAAVRERCLAVIEEETQRHPYNGLTPQETFRYLRDRIRAMGRPAATAAACETCGGKRRVFLRAAGVRGVWSDCPDCDGTGGANGEGVQDDLG